jgi:asparagine synthase (glutamine-hydrolysing)
VLLVAYAAWGPACRQRLNGMFAFAVWNENARDAVPGARRMGQKPLYVAYLAEDEQRSCYYPPAGEEPGMPPPSLSAIAFASELSALRHLPWIDATIDEASLLHYLRLGYVSRGRSIYRGAAQLSTAAHVTATRRRTDPQGYFPDRPASGRRPGPA